MDADLELRAHGGDIGIIRTVIDRSCGSLGLKTTVRFSETKPSSLSTTPCISCRRAPLTTRMFYEELRRLALPLMLELRDQFGETVNLGVQQFDKVTYIEVVPSEFALRLQESRGASVPLHASALGKAILAFSEQDQVEQLIRHHHLEIITPNTITRADDLLAEIKRVRSSGFAFDRGEGSLLAVCIGAPVLDAQGKAVAAMSISGPASRFNPKRDSPVITSLLKAATDLSRALARILNPS